MTIELVLLAASVVLGIVHIIILSHLQSCNAAAVLVVTVTNTHSWLTVWGAHFYFWGRVVCAILYAANLPLARSLGWNIPAIGILMTDEIRRPFMLVFGGTPETTELKTTKGERAC
jgi:MAPEG family